MQLRDWLHKRRMSLSQFARELGVSKQLLSMQLLGDKGLTLADRIEKHTSGAVTHKDLLKERQANYLHRRRTKG